MAGMTHSLQKAVKARFLRLHHFEVWGTCAQCTKRHPVGYERKADGSACGRHSIASDSERFWLRLSIAVMLPPSVQRAWGRRRVPLAILSAQRRADVMDIGKDLSGHLQVDC